MAFKSIMEKIKFTAIEEMLLEKKGFKVGAPLYNGSFSCVCKATYKDTPAVVKVIDLEMAPNDYRIRFLVLEIYAMRVLKHKHLIETLDIFVVDNNVLMFMELADGGDFVDMLHETKALPEDRARYFYRQFGDALRYLHSVDMAHHNIKCENILLNKARTVTKLIDFGFTSSVTDLDPQLSDSYCGSGAYVAPEVLKGSLVRSRRSAYSEPYNGMISDVWSTGVVLFMLTQNRLPFTDTDTKKQLTCQLERNYKFLKTVSKQCKELINMHLDPDVAKRPTMEQVFAHEWFVEDKPQED